MSEGPTPETDVLADLLLSKCSHSESCYYEMRMLARRLERERDDAREASDHTQELLDVAIMLGKMHKRRATWPHDADPFTSPDHDNDQKIYQ